MKFAYLILAHGSFQLLKELLAALDSPDNDIFIHLDVKAGDIEKAPFKDAVKHSKVSFIKKRVDVKWGHVSIVEATLNLMEEALKGHYDYLHLLSGVDFPIKSQSYIQDFFKKNRNKEFVGFSKVLTREDLEIRTVWRQLEGRRDDWSKSVIRINTLLVLVQRWLHLRCISPLDNLKMGSEWFSITQPFAEELVEHRENFLKRYRHVLIPDEMFVQTYMYEHNMMDRVYCPEDEFKSCCRYIDWTRGRPYVWQDGDFEELVNSRYLWARKFFENNMELIHKIADYIKE